MWTLYDEDDDDVESVIVSSVKAVYCCARAVHGSAV